MCCHLESAYDWLKVDISEGKYLKTFDPTYLSILLPLIGGKQTLPQYPKTLNYFGLARYQNLDLAR